MAPLSYFLRGALLLVCPHLGSTSADYAQMMARYCGDLPPRDLVALVYCESRCKAGAYNKREGASGLLQVRHRPYSRMIRARHNLRYGCRMLRAWRRFHKRRACHKHPWWSHWQWGRRPRAVSRCMQDTLARLWARWPR